MNLGDMMMKSCRDCEYFKADDDGEHFKCEMLDMGDLILLIKEDAIPLSKKCIKEGII